MREAGTLMRTSRSALKALYGLLPVRASAEDFEGARERVKQSFPANFAAIALNGLCFPTAGRILGAGLLLTWFVSDLTASAFWVGLIIPVQYGLALIAQPFVAGWLATKRRRAPFYTAQALVRALLWCALGLAAWLLDRGHTPLLLVIFFLVVVADAMAAGVGNIAFSDTLARVIPRRLRGRARSWRGIFGGTAAGVAGLLIRFHFSANNTVAAFGSLFAAAGLLYAAGGLIFMLVDEPEADEPSRSRLKLSDLWRRVRGLWRNAAFRRFVVVESLLVPPAQGLPFFTLFARRTFDLENEALGLLVIIDAAAPIFGNFVWGRLADARGNRWVIVAASLCGLLAPATGVVLYATSNNAWPGAIILGLFSVIVFSVGIASVGIDLATKNYVLDLAPADSERPVYIGVNDTLVGLPTMLLVGVGLIVDVFGFVPLFAGLMALAVTAALCALRLPSFVRAESE